MNRRLRNLKKKFRVLTKGRVSWDFAYKGYQIHYNVYQNQIEFKWNYSIKGYFSLKRFGGECYLEEYQYKVIEDALQKFEKNGNVDDNDRRLINNTISKIKGTNAKS